jgi:LAO/AO transport system kinase
MLVATSVRDAGPSRPRPKRPEVMITTAVSGDGVPELLAALDRHRAAGRQGGAGSAPARLARAEAQVWAVVADRLRDQLHDAAHRAATAQTLAEVADHRLDPYEAADRLLASLEVV